MKTKQQQASMNSSTPAHHTTPPPNTSGNSYEASQTQLTEILTQHLTQNDDSCLSPMDALSPVVNAPRWWGKLIPCSTSSSTVHPIQLHPKNAGIPAAIAEDSYTIGRSLKCDIQVEKFTRDDDSDHQKKRSEWAYGLISNRHCVITCTSGGMKIKDCSGNGTSVNDTLLHKGDELNLSSGDEICLLNTTVVKRKIRGSELQSLLQEYSFVFVPNHLRLSRAPISAVRVRSLAHSMERSQRLYPASAPSKGLAIAADYDLGPVLGSGTVGEVRKAIHKRTGEAVAVKILGRSQLAAEASILRQLSHPYIVRLINVYYEAHTVYLVMELMEKDLFSCIVEKERYEEPEARFVMRRLLAALHYLHDVAQVVHRDLKPENILLRGTGEIKLTDFGLAKQDSDGRLQTFCGTPQYFAPEVLDRAHTVLGRGRYGKPADLWSLGVILYVMLTGCTPRFGSSMIIVWDEADSLLSDEVKDLVEKLLHPDPSERLTVSHACEHRWMLEKDPDDTHQHPLEDPALQQKETETEEKVCVPPAFAEAKVAATTLADKFQATPLQERENRASIKCEIKVPCSPGGEAKTTTTKRHPLSPLNLTKKTPVPPQSPQDTRIPIARATANSQSAKMNAVSPLVHGPPDYEESYQSLRRISGSAERPKSLHERKEGQPALTRKKAKVGDERVTDAAVDLATQLNSDNNY